MVGSSSYEFTVSTQPLLSTTTSIVTPGPHRMRIQYAHPELAASFGRLAVRPDRTSTDLREHEFALGINQAVRAIEECYVDVVHPTNLPVQGPDRALQSPNQHLRMLRSYVDRSVRHARRVITAAENHDTEGGLRRREELLTSMRKRIQMLRREVIRAMRRQQLELRWATGEITRPNKRTLRGTKNGLTPFINRVCYAVTRELGFFALPLMPLAPERHAFDSKVATSREPPGLGIWWDNHLGWIVESTNDVGSSEVSTEVEEGRMAEYWEELEEERRQFAGDDGDCRDEIKEHMYKEALTYESTSDVSMDEESQ